MSENIYKKLIAAGMTHCGACGVMGNLEAESSLKANNLQNTYEKSLGAGDEVYTMAVDNGLYKNFVNDQAGYGLAQWTLASRKRALLEFANNANRSIGDESMQVDFLIHEMRTDFPGLFSFLCSTDDMYEATSRVCKEYERPAVNNVDARYYFAQKWDKYFTLNGIADLDGAPIPGEGEGEPAYTDAEVEILNKLSGIENRLDEILARLGGAG